jgi:hypothetical protein
VVEALKVIVTAVSVPCEVLKLGRVNGLENAPIVCGTGNVKLCVAAVAIEAGTTAITIKVVNFRSKVT